MLGLYPESDRPGGRHVVGSMAHWRPLWIGTWYVPRDEQDMASSRQQNFETSDWLLWNVMAGAGNMARDPRVTESKSSGKL